MWPALLIKMCSTATVTHMPLLLISLLVHLIFGRVEREESKCESVELGALWTVCPRPD